MMRIGIGLMLFAWLVYSVTFWHFGSDYLLLAAGPVLFVAGAVIFVVGWRRQDRWWDRWGPRMWSVSRGGSGFKPAGCKHESMRAAWEDGRQVLSCMDCSYTCTGGPGVPRESS